MGTPPSGVSIDCCRSFTQTLCGYLEMQKHSADSCVAYRVVRRESPLHELIALFPGLCVLRRTQRHAQWVRVCHPPIWEFRHLKSSRHSPDHHWSRCAQCICSTVEGRIEVYCAEEVHRTRVVNVELASPTIRIPQSPRSHSKPVNRMTNGVPCDAGCHPWFVGPLKGSLSVPPLPRRHPRPALERADEALLVLKPRRLGHLFDGF